MNVSRIIRVVGWAYICTTPVVVLLTAWLALVAFLPDFREGVIVCGVFIVVGLISVATDVYWELKQTVLRSRIVYDLAIGLFGWCMVGGYLLYRLLFSSLPLVACLTT